VCAFLRYEDATTVFSCGGYASRHQETAFTNCHTAWTLGDTSIVRNLDSMTIQCRSRHNRCISIRFLPIYLGIAKWRCAFMTGRRQRHGFGPRKHHGRCVRPRMLARVLQRCHHLLNCFRNEPTSVCYLIYLSIKGVFAEAT